MDHLWSPWRMEYIQGNKTVEGCAFCNAVTLVDGPQNLIVLRGEHSFLILNRFPYTSGHIMVVPFQHLPSLDLLTRDARSEMMEFVAISLRLLQGVYRPQGFNMGVNMGEAAGAGIADHVHFHVVPRWMGDTNFMSSISNTRVLPESLEDTYRRLKEALDHLKEDFA